ncbi:mRNA-decapping enzyme subunit 2 [Conoideocrella luteorostrata]|uniref:mRNA-decapping enzyme subunit 2 n=1 Tax=Conoideocrella luteorostrata TaxID=1105319 RepID=A0AAJ0CJQ4_9HYPO|nr:mRNA-decapping enzyme subunit 2 [Conoideocrella luteorostrata]
MATTQMQLEDWLDDLCVRFIINLPQEDLSSVARICFQVEEAQWFYEDFIRPLDPTLPSMTLRMFCLRIFQHCPLLASFSVENHTKAFEEFLQYKTRVPVRGAIMLNHAMDSVVLVKGWKKGANWSFPRGKINKDEDDLDCAVREVYEETGLDLRAAGVVPTERRHKYIEIAMREQQLRLYVFRDIPMDTKFQPRTRKEISKIQWYKLSELPAFRKKGSQNQNESSAGPAVNKFYMVAPFLFPLKKWINSQKKVEERRAASGAHNHLPHHLAVDDAATTEDDTWAPRYSEQATHIPAIETLDGATQELHRLLRMQPPTQGLQSYSHAHPQEDKGSALLSILQSNNARSGSSIHRSGQLPHTPLQGTVSELPQPHNPHHRTNFGPTHIQTRQPPPSFPLDAQKEHASWNHAPSHHNEHQNTTYYHTDMPRQQQHDLNREQSIPTPAPTLRLPNSLLQEQSRYQHGGNFGTHPPDSLAGQSLRSNPLSATPGSANLSGASLALLNAFKRDTAPTQDTQRQSYQKTAEDGTFTAPQGSPYNNQSLPTASLPQIVGSSIPRQMEQSNVSELVGSVVQPAGDLHRSALLGMFKKAPGKATPEQDPRGSTGYNLLGAKSQHTTTQSIQTENMLMRQLQGSRVSSGQNVSLEQLSIQSNPNQPMMIPPGYQNDQIRFHQPSCPQQPQPLARSPFGYGPKQQSQPRRILQRGQNIDDLDNPARQKRDAPSGTSSFVQEPAQTDTGAVSEHSHGSLSGDPSRHHEGSRQQKKQLLSLFGKQQTPVQAVSGPGTGPEEPGEPSRSRISSLASKGGETPISPAEQTFLLGYLQSVTNNAGRR